MLKIFNHNLLLAKEVVILLILLYFSACQSGSTYKPETKPEKEIEDNSRIEKEINSAYENYKRSFANGNGLETANLVCKNTMVYYNSLHDLVLRADSNKLALSGLFERFTVLAIRQTVDWGRLRAMSGNDLFAYAVENGMIGKNVAYTNIGNIVLKNNNLARAELIVGGKPTQKYINFYREDGRWRVDLLEMLTENGKSLKKMIEQPGVNESESLVLFFEKTFGKAPAHELWLPVMQYNKQN